MLPRSLPLLVGAAALAAPPSATSALRSAVHPAADPAAGMLPPLRTFTGQDGLPENAVMGLALAGVPHRKGGVDAAMDFLAARSGTRKIAAVA